MLKRAGASNHDPFVQPHENPLCPVHHAPKQVFGPERIASSGSPCISLTGHFRCSLGEIPAECINKAMGPPENELLEA